MSMLAAIANWSVYAFALLLWAAEMLAYAVGCSACWRSSWHSHCLSPTAASANVSRGTLYEANAIGTAWLRAEAIGHVRGPEIARLLEEYTQLRRQFVTEGQDQSTLDDLNQRTNALQSKIWGHMAAIAREQPNTVSTSLMSALNDAFDEATAERFAYYLRLPRPIFWLLLGMTLLGMSALGFQLGLTGKQVHMLVAFLGVMWTVVIVDILDLASPRLGAFRASPAVYDWTLQGFKGGLQIPPPPGSQ